MQTPPNVFTKTYDNARDLELIAAVEKGSREALEELVKRHQHYIYNVALRFVLSPFDAEDITQEVLIKMITKLHQFQGKSNFRTWLYRITFNHFLHMKKHWLEDRITTFENYGNELDAMQDQEMTAEEKISQAELIKEAKLGCMSGMILCLNREQRLVFILGEIFEVEHQLGSELLDITPANFRKRLERARKDLYNFMHHKCGLINTMNPCRCSRKTKAFIKEGWVDPNTMKFNTAYYQEIIDLALPKDKQLCETLDEHYQILFQKTPFQEKKHKEKLIKTLLQEDSFRKIFQLNDAS